MPWATPQSLTADQVYAVTAYMLHLDEIVPADFELNDGNLLKVAMPNRNGMTTRHGMWTVKGKPDVQGSSCMKDCVAEVRVVSDMPAFARNQHGNLAEQKRPVGPARGIDTAQYDSAKAGLRSPCRLLSLLPPVLRTSRICWRAMPVPPAMRWTASWSARRFVRSATNTSHARMPRRSSRTGSGAAGRGTGARYRCRHSRR